MSIYQRFTLALMLTLKEEEIQQSLDKLDWTTTNVLVKSWLEQRVGLQQSISETDMHKLMHDT